LKNFFRKKTIVSFLIVAFAISSFSYFHSKINTQIAKAEENHKEIKTILALENDYEKELDKWLNELSLLNIHTNGTTKHKEKEINYIEKEVLPGLKSLKIDLESFSWKKEFPRTLQEEYSAVLFQYIEGFDSYLAYLKSGKVREQNALHKAQLKRVHYKEKIRKLKATE
jgi:hypothetical protein